MIVFKCDDSRRGIYHLVNDGKVVYVGATSTIFSRISTWFSNRYVPFDSVHFFPVPGHVELADEESRHIEKYQPEYNRAGVTSPYIRYSKKSSFYIRGKGEKYYFSEIEFLRDMPEQINTGMLKSAHIAENLDEALMLVDLFGFPEPLYLRPSHSLWDRNAVIAWLTNNEQVAA